MKKYIRSASASGRSSEIRSKVKEACDFLGIETPLSISKFHDGYRLTWWKYDQYDNELASKYGPDELVRDTYFDGKDLDQQEEELGLTFDELVDMHNNYFDQIFDNLYKATGIRFVFSDQGDFMYYPDAK